MTTHHRRPICSPATDGDRVVVAAFMNYLRASRDAEARGTTICRAEPGSADGWPCTHDVGHDGPCTPTPTGPTDTTEPTL